MTFTEVCSSYESHCDKTSGPTIGEALERCLNRAVAAQRVAVGIQECVKLLGCAAERVMLCVIPDVAESSDVGLHIQQTLVSSFCWEHDIRLLTVKNTDKLQNFFNLASSLASSGSQSDMDTSSAVSCVLIEVPSDDLNADEEFVCNYHDTILNSNIFPKPVIQLPV